MSDEALNQMKENRRIGEEFEEEEVDEDDEEDEELRSICFRLPWLILSCRQNNEYLDHQPLHQLETFLDNWSSNDPSIDYSAPMLLGFWGVIITRPLIYRLLPFLRHDEAPSASLHDGVDRIDHSPGTSTMHDQTPVLKFSQMEASPCVFFSQSDARTAEDEEYVCTSDDKHSFLSALARLPSSLSIEDNGNSSIWNLSNAGTVSELLPCLLSTSEIDHFQAESLGIDKEARLSDVEYVRLGAMIQRSLQVKKLFLILPFAELPQAFYDSLANSIQIQTLTLRYYGSDNQIEPILANLIAREDGNGVVERLLRNPKSRLRELDLSGTNLQDHHLVAIATLLPSSHVEKIDFSDTRIQAQGLLEFARHLPQMHSLKTISLDYNPWEDAPLESIQECATALLHGLRENPSITEVDDMEKFPHYPELLHYLSLNLAGRKILTASPQEPPIPDGLWPPILARAGRSKEDGGPCPVYIHEEDMETYTYHGPTNAVYFFLQHCPKLFSYF